MQRLSAWQNATSSMALREVAERPRQAVTIGLGFSHPADPLWYPLRQIELR